MNILFYIESHPIRNSFTEFYWIVEELLKMIDDEFNSKNHTISTIEIRLLCSRHIHDKIVKHLEHMNINRFILGLTNEENNYILDKYHKHWDKSQLNVWKELLKGVGEISNFYESIIERVYQSYQFDTIVYWGTNGAIKNFSKKHNIPAISMELGCTRSPFFQSCYFDFKGVNGNAYTNDIDLDSFEQDYSLEEIQTFLPVKQFKDKSFDAIHDVINDPSAGYLYRTIGKNVLLPLQLMDDANIILYSKYSSMLEFLEDVLPKLTTAGYCCFVKPHPGNIFRVINADDHQKCKKFCEAYNNVHWLENFENNKYLLSLYSKIDYFVVINSSVGFEAMLLGKIVIPLGQSPYNISNELPTLSNLLEGNIDKVSYQKTLIKIVNFLLFNYLYFKDEAFNFNSFISAIEFNSKLFFLYNNDKKSFQDFIPRKSIQSQSSYLRYPTRKSLNGIKF